MKIELAALIENMTMQCKNQSMKVLRYCYVRNSYKAQRFGTFRFFYKQSRDEPWGAWCHRVATAFSNKILPVSLVHFLQHVLRMAIPMERHKRSP
jgi:hypothetical protein